MTKVLALEPYYGGSHQYFLDGLSKVLEGGIDLITLPPRAWKWRMRLAAPWFAAELQNPLYHRLGSNGHYRSILCSSLMDVATLKALLPRWAKDLPICPYFHENQFAYPVRESRERDVHFALTNLTTALAGDRLAFNSNYNLESMLTGVREILKKAPDISLHDAEEQIRGKSRILYPALDFTNQDALEPRSSRKPDAPPVILWNHRWEHDKNPELFFQMLDGLIEADIEFEVIILGKKFRIWPAIFDSVPARLGHRIIHWGYTENRQEYLYWLSRADMVVSTALHEFFGLSVIEAVRAGCRPLLPRRLSYPELFPRQYLYDDTDIIDRLKAGLQQGPLPQDEAKRLTEPFSWSFLTEKYRIWLQDGQGPLQ